MVKMKIDKLKKNVIKHLQSEGFVCLEQDRGKFPHIIAWHPLIDAGGKLMTLDTSFSKDGKENKIDGRQTLVFLKTIQGWKIIHEHGTIRTASNTR